MALSRSRSIRRFLPYALLLLVPVAMPLTVVLVVGPLADALGTVKAAAVSPRSPFLETQATAPGAPGAASARKWYKGNTHTHTLNSDGDSTPDDVVRWYRDARYQFLVLTDHNFLTAVDTLNALHGADEKFLVIKGEEVSSRFDKKPLHINGLNPREQVTAVTEGGSVVEVLQKNVDAIRRVEGIPHINHPNFGWAITGAELGQLRNTKLFELYNGHPSVNNVGGGGVPGLEEVWDQILSSGQEIYGIAVDDAHTFKQPWNLGAARPGFGWVVVRASSLAPREIVTALDRGEFYASTGVELSEISVTAQGLSITITEKPSSKYRVQFIGKHGKLLREVITNPAVYDFTGEEGYVRAKVLESNGKFAWVQPVFLTPAPATSSAQAASR